MTDIEHSNMAWSDESLILFFYNELEPVEANKLSEELAQSDQLQQRYRLVTKVLDTGLTADLPRPNKNFNQNIMAAVYQSLERQENKSSQSKSTALNQWQMFLDRVFLGFKISYTFSFTLFAILGFSLFYMGRMSVEIRDEQELAITNDVEQLTNDQQSFSEVESQRVLYASLEKHLNSSSRLLTNVSNIESSDSTQLSQRTQHINDLISFNRLYRQLIEKAGDKQLTHLLMQMESILLELKNAKDESNPEMLIRQHEFERVKQRLDSSDLLFKLKVSNRKIKQKTI